jgi:hypothetical protein
LTAADINISTLEKNSFLIKTLVSRRNNIAHGKNDLIEEVSYYRTYESAVYDLMYELAFALEKRINEPPYV